MNKNCLQPICVAFLIKFPSSNPKETKMQYMILTWDSAEVLFERRCLVGAGGPTARATWAGRATAWAGGRIGTCKDRDLTKNEFCKAQES